MKATDKPPQLKIKSCKSEMLLLPVAKEGIIRRPRQMKRVVLPVQLAQYLNGKNFPWESKRWNWERKGVVHPSMCYASYKHHCYLQELTVNGNACHLLWRYSATDPLKWQSRTVNISGNIAIKSKTNAENIVPRVKNCKNPVKNLFESTLLILLNIRDRKSKK